MNRSRELLIAGLMVLMTFGGTSKVWSDGPVSAPIKVPRPPAPAPPKIEPALTERLQTLRGDETVKVGVWFTIPDYKTILRSLIDGRTDEGLRQQFKVALSAGIQQGSQPLVALLSGRGFGIKYVSTAAPVLFASLDQATVETLAQRNDVEAIYLSRTYQPSMEHASKSTRADVVWARGIDGWSGTKIAVVEVPDSAGGSRIERPHPYIPGANDSTTAFRPNNPVSGHATRVAARIAAVRTPPDRWRGVAPGVAPLYSANSVSGGDDDIIEASDSAISQGVSILNFSLSGAVYTGVPDLLSRYCDFIVFNQTVSVTVASGNHGTVAHHVIANPGLSYNAITVGAYEDNDDNSWWNPRDQMWAGSSFRDPPDAVPPVGQDRELPEVVAVGATIEMPTTGGGISIPRNGTSYAAPAVAGVAALIMDRQPGIFEPEIIKAIIMASACHNIEGDSRLSDLDGVGGVVACEADEIARDNKYYGELFDSTDFDGPAPAGKWTYNGMTLERSLEARVVICWNVPTAGAADSFNYPAAGRLQADLDLRVYNPDGSLASWSLSYDNNYEIVEFTPTQTGVHRIEVNRFSWTDSLFTWLGLAWTQAPCCSPDWGDAPDEMMHCSPRPKRGNFPTLELSNGANATEFEVEWLSKDNTTTPGATWELDANVDTFQVEQDQDHINNIDTANCIPNQDAKDDGVRPMPIYVAGRKDSVTFWVNSATPNVGRYSGERADERIFVSGWFDWEHDDSTWADNLEVEWHGAPGTLCSMLVGTCIEGCGMWPQDEHQRKVVAEFDVPEFLPSGPFWIRFRTTYGEHDKSIIWTDTSVYGEVEDHVSYQITIPWIRIEKTHYTIQGQYEYVSITTENSDLAMGGFDFLIAYDASALAFTSAERGQLLDDCGWEYFTYRHGIDGNCGDACPSGLLRIFAMAETNNGPNHPSCYAPPDTDPHELARMRFLVTNDRTFECQYLPIRFYWDDCGDNSISSVDGELVYIDHAIYDFEGNLLWEEDDDDVFPDDARPQGLGAPDDCLNPDPEKPSAVRLIDFFYGGVDLICADSIDAGGDINLNGEVYEIADAVLFTNYFIYGLSVFTVNIEGQIAATDVNGDGLTLTVADLVALVRIVVGEEPAGQKPAPVVATYQTGRTISVTPQMAAALVIVSGDVIPKLLADNMEMKYNFDGENTRILIYSFEERQTFEGDFLDINGAGVLNVELATYSGAPVMLMVLPTEFALHQNYPNPFNPVTKISFAVPAATDYELVIFNVQGQTVKRFSGHAEPGIVELFWDASNYASGIYLYRLIAENFTDTKKMVLLK